MDSKKVNIFSFIMVLVMCVFTICVAFTFKGTDGSDGTDGKSAYEIAVDNGYSGTEVEYLMSLQGEDGTSVTIDDLYNTYLTVSGKTSEEVTYIEFIQTYFDDLVNVVDVTTQTELATQIALRSTVDICYSYYYDEIIYGYLYDSNTFCASSFDNYYNYNVAAGSGIIYKMEDSDGDKKYDTAYIITNYHVLYVEYYITQALIDEGYRVYYDENTGEFFTAYYDESMKSGTTYRGWSSYTVIDLTDVKYADYLENFLESYNIYVYGYQDEKYAISATFVGGSADNDIAVLKVDLTSTNSDIFFSGNYVAATIGDSSEISVGESVIAVGNPLLADTSSISKSDFSTTREYVEAVESAYIDSLCLTATSGVVSNLSEYCTMSSIIDSSSTITLRLIRVDAAINAGNSGGGLYDCEGRLVGIVNAKIVDEEYDNVGYAIPINIASRIADQIISYCNGSTTTQISIVNSSSLGISVSNGDSSTKFNGTTWLIKHNIVISSVESGSLAEDAGLSAGDIIVSITINGVTYTTDYEQYISSSSDEEETTASGDGGEEETSTEEVYKWLTNAYDVDDALLSVIYGNTATYTITIVYLTSDGSSNVETKSTSIEVSADSFTTLN